MATFGINYGLQTVSEGVARCPKVGLWYFGPFPANRLLELVDTLVFFSDNLTLQNTLGRKFQRFFIWNIWSRLYAKNQNFYCFFGHSSFLQH